MRLASVQYHFGGEIFYWRGPSPYYFVRVPADECTQLRAEAADVSYGWGMIPVAVRIGSTQWETSLFPKDGRYLVPIKDRVRSVENLEDGETVTVSFTVAPRSGRPTRSDRDGSARTRPPR